MAVKVDNFTKDTATPTGSNAISGLGFTPKSLICVMTLLTTANTITDGDICQCIGLYDGTNQRAFWAGSEDNPAGNTNTQTYLDPDQFLVMYDQSGTLLAEADVTFDSDGFTLNWTTNNAIAYIIHYFATDQGSEVVTVTTPASTGSQTVSTTNVPKALFFATGGHATENSVTNHNVICYGFATGSSNEAAITWRDRNNRATSDVDRELDTNRCFIYKQTGGTSLVDQAALTSFDSGPNGFTLDWSAVNGLQNKYYAMAFYEGEWEAGNGVAPTTATTKAFTTAFEPEAVLIGSVYSSVETNQSGAGPSFGFTDGTNEACMVCSSVNATGTPNTKQAIYNDAVLQNMDGTGTLNQEAAFSSFNATDFTLSWSTANGTARTFIYLAMKSESGHKHPLRMNSPLRGKL